MICHEDKIFSAIANALRARYDAIYVTGVELSDTPPQFPAVSIIQRANEVNTRYSTFEYVENVTSEEYQFEICSNLEEQREAKAQTKEILGVIDEVMCGLYYPRTFSQPIPSADAKYTRHVARYKRTNLTQEDL